MEELTFEKAVQKLEKITLALENGELGLEESMKYYEQGTRLAEFCSKKLNEAQLKIEQLNEIKTEESADK